MNEPIPPLKLTMPRAYPHHGKRESDYYPTPRWVTRLLLEECPPPRSRTVVEPAAGEGAICEVLLGERYAVSAYELREECKPALDGLVLHGSGFHYSIADWLKLPQRHASAIITNPPFTLALEFARACLDTGAPYVALLLRLGFLASLERSRFINKYPPTQLLVLGRRPSFTGNGQTDATDYAWFLWEHDAAPRAPRVLVP